VERPAELAAFVLRDQAEWDETRIREAMDAGVEKHVALKDTLPVHIVYMTAWVDEAGTVQFGPDVYGYDATESKLD
jgi:murein L,D-transpeptidase YcbB/YkuD